MFRSAAFVFFALGRNALEGAEEAFRNETAFLGGLFFYDFFVALVRMFTASSEALEGEIVIISSEEDSWCNKNFLSSDF